MKDPFHKYHRVSFYRGPSSSPTPPPDREFTVRKICVIVVCTFFFLKPPLPAVTFFIPAFLWSPPPGFSCNMSCKYCFLFSFSAFKAVTLIYHPNTITLSSDMGNTALWFFGNFEFLTNIFGILYSCFRADFYVCARHTIVQF